MYVCMYAHLNGDSRIKAFGAHPEDLFSEVYFEEFTVFPSPRPVTVPKLNSLICPTNYL